MTATRQRNTERLLLAIPIRVLGVKCQQGEFIEDARTVVVNDRGARLALRQPVASNDTLRIINLNNYQKADFRVVSASGTSDQGVPEWGVECLDPKANIWGIEFSPPLHGKPGALLQCRECRREGFAPLGPGELELLTEKGSIARVCAQCRKSTEWEYSSIHHPSREHEFGTGVASPQRPASAAPPNRRIDPRRGAKVTVQVRNATGQEELSVTENLSSGGLAVSLAMDLKVGDAVEVVRTDDTSRPQAGSPATVRRRAAYPLGGRRLYGLQFAG